MQLSFGKKKNDDTKGKEENPWFAARREWNAHEGGVIASRRMWQVVGICCLLIALAAVGGVVHIGQQSKFIPYVIQVDKLGQALATGRADQAAPEDKRVLQATVASFIADVRLVTPDVAVQRKAVFNTYAFLRANDPATKKIGEFYEDKATNPFQRAADETVFVEIASVLQQSPETWQVDWVEEIRDRQGGLKNKQRMRALLTIYVSPPTAQTSEEEVRRNPLGIYVRDFNWSKQL